MLVNLLSLRGGFSWRRYRVDLQGFAASWGIVGLFLIIALALAYLCRIA